MHLFLVGAGHVGLVTALGLAKLGHRVTVADIDAARIAALRDGQPPIFEPGLEEGLAACSAAGMLSFTTTPDPPAGASCSIVCVNTPTTAAGPLDMTNVETVVARLLEVADVDHTIVIRSTLPLDGPDRLQALASRRRERAAVVTNPEFMREGAALADFERPSRVVVGWLESRDRDAARRVAELYAPLGAPVVSSDARSVTLIKLASNVFLATKIAFVNELARLSEAVGAEVETVATGIGLDPRIGRQFLAAGPGFGGSCLPEQAVGLAQQAAARGVAAPLLASVSHSNDVHQEQIVRRLAGLLDGDGDGLATGDRRLAGFRVALFGLAFKANTDDVRTSPALRLAGHLRGSGAGVVGYDPRASERARVADPDLEVAETPLAAAAGSDAVLIATEWPEFARLDWAEVAREMRGRVVLDTRAVADADAVRGAGLRYDALGRRSEPGGAS